MTRKKAQTSATFNLEDSESIKLQKANLQKAISRPRGGHGKRSRNGWLSSISTSTLQASGILVLAILTSMLWNTTEPADPKIKALINNICRNKNSDKDDVYCHKALLPTRRTQMTRHGIPTGTRILEIPRQLQIWDIDALQDDFVRENLLTARMEIKSTPTTSLSSAAFLAAFLSVRLFKNVSSVQPPLKAQYLSTLPTYSEYAEYHPILWEESELDSLLGSYSYTNERVTSIRQLYISEYKAFAAVSAEFSQIVSLQDYLVARLTVATRSFGTGPLNIVQDIYVHSSLTTAELDAAIHTAGLDFSEGCHALVPLLDLYDHHARPHVAFSYDATKQSFVISAIRNIDPGSEIFDSYGKRTDPDLFAKYGFVNGDGSDYSQASIALWHKVELGIEPSVTDADFRRRIATYLQYDDGYANCVDKGQPKAWDLKRMKFRYLYSRSLKGDHWVATFGPRDTTSTPALASNQPIKLKPPAFNPQGGIFFNGTTLFSTCRLITLTHHDYQGEAMTLLLEHQDDLDYILPDQPNEALELRTLMCMARFASTAMERFGRSLPDQEQLVSQLNKDSFQSREWTTEHLRLGEMQTLDAIKRLAFGKMRAYGDKINSETAFTLRDQPCERMFLEPFIKEILTA